MTTATEPCKRDYRELAPTDVDPGIRDVAETTFRIVCHRLGLTGVRLRWFAPLDDLDRLDMAQGEAEYHTFEGLATNAGFIRPASPGDIWIRATRDQSQVISTVAHELRHAWQFRTWGPLPTSVVRPGVVDEGPRTKEIDRRERDALRFDQLFLAEVNRGRNH